MRDAILDLTLDDVPLRTLNARDAHWSDRSKHSDLVRTTVAWKARTTKPRVRFDNGPVRIHITLLAPDRRRRDPDNLAAGCKPIIDGLVDGGWLPDDSWHHVDEVAYSCFPADDVAQPPGWVVHVTVVDDMPTTGGVA